MTEPPGERALTVLAAGQRTPTSREALATLTVGERDRRLLLLRVELFGPTIDAVVTCATCSEPVELSFEVADVLVSREEQTARTVEIATSAGPLTVRVPVAEDLSAAYGAGDVDEAMSTLLDRIIVSGGESDELGPDLHERIATALAAADPQAEVVLDAICPACGGVVNEPLDVAAFVWSEISTWAARLLGDVHALARAYGWREEDVFALSPLRRRFYLEAVGG